MNTPEITLNHEQQLYVIKTDYGYSCLGFDVCRDQTLAYAKWLGKTELPVPYASIEAYQLYETLVDEIIATGKRCDAELCPQLVGLEGKRVEVTDAYGKTRRFYVGKSTGSIPIHLEIARKNSSGGPAVMGSPFKSVRVIGRSR